MNVATHTFKLPTGIECEVKELTGKEQDILTRSDKKTHSEKLNDLLKSVVVRIGSVNKLEDSFIDALLECDKQHILVEVRQFSMGFAPDFEFTWKYTTQDGKLERYPLKERIEDGHFPMRPLQVPNPNYNKDLVGTEDEQPELIPATYSDYSEVDRYVYLTLPRSQKKVRFSFLDGKGHKILKMQDKSLRSSSTPILMRNPVYFEIGDEKQNIPITLNLNSLAIADIEFLRKAIKDREGRVDTEISFEHPEAEFKSASEKTVIVDVLSTVAFFFPSEAI